MNVPPKYEDVVANLDAALGREAALIANANQHKLAMDAACGEIELLQQRLTVAEQRAGDQDEKIRKLEWYKTNHDSMWASENWPELWRKDEKFSFFADQLVGRGEYSWICDIPRRYRYRCMEAFKAGERSVIRQPVKQVVIPEIDPDFEVWWLETSKTSVVLGTRDLALSGFSAAIAAAKRLNGARHDQ